MTLENWLNEDKIKPHTTTAKEIENLLKVIERDIADAMVIEVSPDRRFAIAYNAALQLATIALLVSGYRITAGKGHHYHTITSLQYTMGQSAKRRIKYLNLCRQARNQTDYDRVDVTEESEVVELLKEVKQFRQDVLGWLSQNHPHLSQRLEPP